MKIDEDALLRNIKSLIDADDEGEEAFDKAFENLEDIKPIRNEESLEGSK